MQKSTRASLLASMALGMVASVPGLAESTAKLASVEARTSNQGTNRAESQKQQPNQGISAAEQLALLMGMYRGSRGPSYPNGPGWTNAQVQRMARKKRNQRRNRLAHR